MKNERQFFMQTGIYCVYLNVRCSPLSSQYLKFLGKCLHKTCLHSHIHSIDPSVCLVACRYETSHNTMKIWLYKTITSHISETSARI